MATRKTATATTAETAPAKKTAAKKPAAKKTAAKKAAAKKTPAKKPVAQKAAVTPVDTAVETVAKPAAKKVAKKAAKKVAKKTVARKGFGKRSVPAPGTNPLYMDKEEYNATIQGLVDQGLDREDAVLTLKVGMRQANGKPLPQELLMQCNGDPRVAFDAQSTPSTPTETAPAVNDEAVPEERNAA